MFAGIYGAGFAYFSHHFIPGTTVNGIDVSWMTRDDLEKTLRAQVDTWHEQVTSPGGFSLAVNAADVGLSTNVQQVGQTVWERMNAAYWPFDLLWPHTFTVDEGISVNQDRLASFVSDAVMAFNETADAPTNAAATFDKKSGTYVVSEQGVGTKLDSDAVVAAVAADAVVLAPSRELDAAMLAQPTVTSTDPDLLAAVDTANTMLSANIDLTLESDTVETVSRTQIHRWLSIDKDHTVSLDKKKIRSWISKKASDVAAYEDDEYIYALDAKKTANALVKAIKKGSHDPVEIRTKVVETKPALTPGAKDRGRHLDVNLDTQYARFYDAQGTVIWETYIVSGNTSTGHDTPTGTFAIQARQRDQTLIGADEDHDKKPDYKSFVSYWMPFASGGYGLHDAPWRSSFGGYIYQYDGSHGCINLPPERAAELFDLVEVGDMVYIHM